MVNSLDGNLTQKENKYSEQEFREIIAEAKKRVENNPPKTAQEAWTKFETVRKRIIASVKEKD